MLQLQKIYLKNENSNDESGKELKEIKLRIEAIESIIMGRENQRWRNKNLKPNQNSQKDQPFSNYNRKFQGRQNFHQKNFRFHQKSFSPQYHTQHHRYANQQQQNFPQIYPQFPNHFRQQHMMFQNNGFNGYNHLQQQLANYQSFPVRNTFLNPVYV